MKWTIFCLIGVCFKEIPLYNTIPL